MATSQNGWPVVGKDACDQGPFEGVTFPNGILKGDVAKIARWQLAQYKAHVEPLHAGECWGWFVKEIEGSSTISNHASATAWDINAPDNPMGVPTSRSLSEHQINACHAIEAASQGTLRWGGDFTRPDPMHWEIVGSRSQVAAFAAWIRAQEEELPVDQATFNKLMDGWARTPNGAAVLNGLTLNDKIGDAAVPTRTVGDNERDFAKLRGTLVLAPEAEPKNKVMQAGSPLDRMVRAADAILAEKQA